MSLDGLRLAAVAILVALVGQGAAAASRLPLETVVIRTHGGPKTFRMEIASDQASRQLGLMHRAHLARDAGMLFDLGGEVMASFWMKDTPLPLDMLFVRSDGSISTIAADAVPYSTAEIFAAEPVRAVIEINGGLARTLGIAPGDRVEASIFRGPARR